MPRVLNHYLMPYEEWYCKHVLKRQLANNNPAIVRAVRRYGQEGVILYGAIFANIAIGMAVGWAGVALLIIFMNSSVGYYIAVAGILFIMFGIVRSFQCARAGRASRRERSSTGS